MSHFVPGLAVVLTLWTTITVAQESESPSAGVTRQPLSTELESVQIQVLQNLLYRNRTQERKLMRSLDTIEQHFNLQQWEQGVSLLQQLLELPEDGLLWLNDSGQAVGVRTAAMRLLQQGGPRVWRAYQQQFGPRAQQHLQVALEDHDQHKLRDVIRRYYFTQAGFTAMWVQGTESFDQGHFAAAAETWTRLASEPVHRNRITDVMRWKIAAAWHLGGHPQRSREVIASLSGKPIKLQNEQRTAEEWLARLTPDTEGIIPAPGQLATDSATNSRKPFVPLLEPNWVHTYETKPDDITKTIHQWEQREKREGRSVAVTNHPLVIGERILFRDFSGIRAIDANTGKLAWQYQDDRSFLITWEQFTKQQRVQRLLRQDRSEINDQVETWRSEGPLAFLESSFLANSVLGSLSHDRHRVYAVTDMKLGRGLMPLRRRFGENNESNELIALELEPDSLEADATQSPLWAVGGSARSDELQGHFFYGPPLVLGDTLYVLAEHRSLMHLIALEARTGKVRWKQGISLVPQSILFDFSRSQELCSLVHADGVLVCQTQLGTVVAADAQTGNLLWNGFVGDGDTLFFRTAPEAITDESFGNQGFVSRLHVAGESVVLMSQHSEYIHCWNLHTGEPRWRVARVNPLRTGVGGQGEEYIATVTDRTVLVIGGRYCRGLDLQTGQERWSQKLSLPSGTGLVFGDSYLLPLQSGQLVTLEIETGQQIGPPIQPVTVSAENSDERSLPADWSPGNLLLCDRQILSVEPTRIVAFPLADTVRFRLQVKGSLTQTERFHKAAASFALNDLRDAKQQLETLLRETTEGTPLQHATRQQLRDVLFHQWTQQAESLTAEELSQLLERLEALCETESQRLQFQTQLARWQTLRDEDGSAVKIARDVRRNTEARYFPVGDSSDELEHSPEVWQRWLEQQKLASLSPEARHVQRKQQQTRLRTEIAAVDSFFETLREYTPDQLTPELRLQLAKRCLQRGEYQKAELLLLANRDDDDRNTALQSTVMLIELWSNLGLERDAVSLLAELHATDADITLNDGRTLGQIRTEFTNSSALELAWRQRQPLPWKVQRVNITHTTHLPTSPLVSHGFQSQTAGLFNKPGTSLQLRLARSSSSYARWLHVIDRKNATITAKIPLPEQSSLVTASRNTHVGHLHLLESPQTLGAISLLESGDESLYWLQPQPSAEGVTREKITPGPIGPTFCVFQAPGRLIMVDPLTGRIRWQRSGLDSNAGLLRDPAAGMFGDQHVLVVLQANREHFVMYDTATGEELRHGRLPMDTTQTHRAFGRILFFITRTPEGDRARLWDPLEDCWLLDEALAEESDVKITDSGELALVVPGPTLKIVEPETGELLLTTPLKQSELDRAVTINIFKDQQRYYVNLRYSTQPRWSPNPAERPQYFKGAVIDTLLPAEHVQGTLIAIDRKTGRHLWQKSTPSLTLLQLPEFDLPFLVAGIRYSSTNHRRERWLKLEILHAETGELIGESSLLEYDQLFHADYDPDTGTLDLQGRNQTIHLRFPRTLQQLNLQDPVW